MSEVDRFSDALSTGEFHAAIRIAEAALAEGPSLEGALRAFAAYAFAEDPEGALALLDRCARLLGEAAALVDVLRGCARCDISRRARETDGDLALRRALLGSVPPHSLRYFEAAACHARGDWAAAARALEDARRTTPAVGGLLRLVDGKRHRFQDIRDTDLVGLIACVTPRGRILLPLRRRLPVPTTPNRISRRYELDLAIL